ncbi:FAD-binding domain protein [Ceratobasidium sp. AG-Ba]|nr:FAD-binding domain protein [Ceratobasidium sp. AG-Ba]
MTSQISVLILGAGCFGLSAALELLSRGYKNVTIVDRAPELPAPDAASTDLNKIVRSAYRKDAYTRLARESIKEWKTGDWDGAYHESGILVCGGATGTPYSRAAQENDIAAGGRVTLLPTVESIKSIFPAGITIGEIAEAEDRGQGITAKNSCYLNADGGWVEATTAMKALLRKVRAYEGHGVKILAGCRVTGLEIDADGSAAGVKIARNEEQDQGKEGVLKADVIVLATGAWSSSLFPDDSFGLSRLMKATGQSVLSVQLTPEELAKYSKCPSFFDTATGLYTMPPTASGLLKWGLHHTGALSSHKVSTPRTGLAADNAAPLNPNAKIGVDGAGVPCAVPKSIITPMRDAMRKLYPDIADRDAASSRICWYADTIDEDWIIDYHPNHPRILFATGGSGHAFKFLPVLGRVIADRLENKLDKESNELFSFTRPRSAEHVERVGEYIRIDETQLSTIADLRGAVA